MDRMDRLKISDDEEGDSDYEYGLSDSKHRDEARPTVILMGLKRFLSLF